MLTPTFISSVYKSKETGFIGAFWLEHGLVHVVMKHDDVYFKETFSDEHVLNLEFFANYVDAMFADYENKRRSVKWKLVLDEHNENHLYYIKKMKHLVEKYNKI